MSVFTRPDGRDFVREPLPVDGVYGECREEELERWLAAGYVVVRREDEYLVPTQPPVAHGFLSLADVDLDRLRLLDEELRQDTPGAAGWRWEPDAFRRETSSDPSVYLVASEYAGICRLWLREPTPRLGFIGVRRVARGRGLARELVRAALGGTRALGYGSVTCEIDTTNVASQRLFASFGARRIGGYAEVFRPRP